MTLSDSQRNELRAELAPEGYDGSVASRAQIVLWHDGGRSAPEIAALMSTSKVTVYKWLQRYQEGGLAALGSRKSTGRPRGISGEARSRILALTRQAPPESTGLTHWSSYEMARYLRRNEGIEVSHNFISVLWRENGIKPHRQGTFKLSRDPDFTAKVVDVVGLYLDPPAGAVVLSVDEKTQVQALDRTQPLLPVSFGKTEKRTHDYKRNGTTNLFAAFDTGTGEVTGRCFSRRRTREFLMFMDEMAQRHPSQETHVVLDNLSTHSGPQVSKWLARHQNFRFITRPSAVHGLIRLKYGSALSPARPSGVARSARSVYSPRRSAITSVPGTRIPLRSSGRRPRMKSWKRWRSWTGISGNWNVIQNPI
jgi:transposase